MTGAGRDGQALTRLLTGDPSVPLVRVEVDGTLVARPEPERAPALLSGSFNPLHEGHLGLAGAASELLGREVLFELPVVNADKPALDEAELRARLERFRGLAAVLLTRAPLFVQKARLFPGATFVLGYDTAVRLVQARFYGASEAAMHEALEEMRGLGCRFLVAGRLDGAVFHTLEEAPVPLEFSSMFEQIPESLFRADVSSTALRLEG